MNNLIEWLIELRWHCVELRWGEVSEWEGESERANEWLWCMGAENDHLVNVRSSSDRMLTAQFDRLEVSLAWNCIKYVFVDQLSSAIIHNELIWYDMISGVNLIWTPILPPRTPDIIAHWQVAPPARPPSRWLPHMILTEPCCSFPDIPNMGWHNKKIF